MKAEFTLCCVFLAVSTGVKRKVGKNDHVHSVCVLIQGDMHHRPL